MSDSSFFSFIQQMRDSRTSDTTIDLARLTSPILKKDVVAASIAINLLSLGLPLVTLQVYDRIIPNQATQTLYYLAIGLGLVILLDAGLKLARAAITSFIGARFEHSIGTQAIRRLLASDLETAEKQAAGTHLDRISGIDTLRDFYSGNAALSLLDLPFALIFLTLIGYIGGWLVLAPLLILLTTIWAALWLGQQLKSHLDNRKTWDDRRFNFIIETLSGVHTIKGLAMEQLMMRRYERLLRNTAEAGHNVTLTAHLSQSLGHFANQLALATVAAFGALMVMKGQLTIGSLAACTLLAGRSVQPVLRALGSWSRFQNVTLARDKLQALATLPLEQQGDTKITQARVISLENASYTYSDTSPLVLKNANFTAKRGEFIAIKGENGVGKSTLLNLLSGRLVPTQGQLKVNGDDATLFTRQSMESQIAYISQHPALFKGSVLENLTFFTGDDLLDNALDFAARLGLDQVFARLPDGYDTQVGQASANSLPKGVAQRIAIVRALARRPAFVLFDESNASLDFEAEGLLRSTLEAIRSDTGIIFVTYRPSLIKLADKVYTLDTTGLSGPVVQKAN